MLWYDSVSIIICIPLNHPNNAYHMHFRQKYIQHQLVCSNRPIYHNYIPYFHPDLSVFFVVSLLLRNFSSRLY